MTTWLSYKSRGFGNMTYELFSFAEDKWTPPALGALFVPCILFTKSGWDPGKNPEQNTIFEILIKILFYQSSFYEKY